MTVTLQRPHDPGPSRSADTDLSNATSLLAFAYMRVPCDISDDKVQRMEHELRRFAERMSLHLAAIYRETICGSHDVFEDMVLELLRTGARHVLVPTFRHLALNRVLQNSMLIRLEFDADTEVFELVETD